MSARTAETTAPVCGQDERDARFPVWFDRKICGTGVDGDNRAALSNQRAHWRENLLIDSADA